MKLLIPILGCILFTSCATMSEVEYEIIEYSTPSINKETTKNVGDILLEKGVAYTANTIEILKKSAEDRVYIGTYIEVGTQTGWTIYKPVEVTGAKILKDTNLSSLKNNNSVYELFLAENNTGLYRCWYGGFNNIIRSDLIPPQNYKKSHITTSHSSNYQQTLIYLGKDGNNVKFTYREFLNDVARPAFTLDVQYNLNDTHQIKFKDAIIEIVNASSNSIEYKVIKQF